MADSNVYIPDASVLIKLLTEEDDSAKVFQIIDDFHKDKIELITPSLCYYEILNYLGLKKVPNQLGMFNDILGIQIIEQDLGVEIANIALGIMDKIPKISFYDAAYHATAIFHEGTFITADENYYNKAKKLKRINLLKDY